jgi:hypothetical protein
MRASSPSRLAAVGVAGRTGGGTVEEPEIHMIGLAPERSTVGEVRQRRTRSSSGERGTPIKS